MGYIYKITNDINDKIYIGKTEFDIQKRFYEHCKDSKRGYTNRPLYNAMNKFGIEHFSIEEIEQCEENLEQREQYWIQYYDSFYNGYNATLGGDGKAYIDYNYIIELFIQGLNITEIAKKTNHDSGHISKILKEKGNISQKQIDKIKSDCERTVKNSFEYKEKLIRRKLIKKVILDLLENNIKYI